MADLPQSPFHHRAHPAHEGRAVQRSLPCQELGEPGRTGAFQRQPGVGDTGLSRGGHEGCIGRPSRHVPRYRAARPGGALRCAGRAWLRPGEARDRRGLRQGRRGQIHHGRQPGPGPARGGGEGRASWMRTSTARASRMHARLYAPNRRPDSHDEQVQFEPNIRATMACSPCPSSYLVERGIRPWCGADPWRPARCSSC